MINNRAAASTDAADTVSPPSSTTVNRPRRRCHRPTVVDDAPPDWEWEDWAARFWGNERPSFADDDAGRADP